MFQEDAGQRLDKYLQKYLKLAPKASSTRMLRKKNIVLNGKKADGSEKLKQGDVIRLYLSDETLEKFREEDRSYPVWPDLEIVYEDRQVLMVNKPAGMLSSESGAGRCFPERVSGGISAGRRTGGPGKAWLDLLPESATAWTATPAVL